MNALSNSPSPLRVGVVGLGWAGQQHLEAYSAIPGVEVVAIAGKETAVGERLLAEWDVPRLFDDWQDLVALPELDAVSVAVPTFLHAPIAIAALERGLHVLSEKPIARNADEAERMVAAARGAGRVLDVAFNHRRRGDIQALRRLVAGGDLGVPYHVRTSWMRRRGIPGAGSWFVNLEKSGGGPLVDLGVHVLDWSLHVLGEPRVLAVSAVSHGQLGPALDADYEVEDLASALIRLEGGASLALETSWAAFRDEDDLMDISVLGTGGGAELRIVGATETPVGELTVFRDTEAEVDDYVVPAEPGRAHRAVVEEFVAVVRDPSTWSDHDGTLALGRARIIDACYRSAAEGREVVL